MGTDGAENLTGESPWSRKGRFESAFSTQKVVDVGVSGSDGGRVEVGKDEGCAEVGKDEDLDSGDEVGMADRGGSVVVMQGWGYRSENTKGEGFMARGRGIENKRVLRRTGSYVVVGTWNFRLVSPFSARK